MRIFAGFCQDCFGVPLAPCLLKLCVEHCIRDAVEPGHAGRSHLQGDKESAAALLKSRIDFSARRLPLVLFDFFWRWTLKELRAGTLGEIGKQENWALYFEQHKLKTEIVDGVPLLNACWRSGLRRKRPVITVVMLCARFALL